MDSATFWRRHDEAAALASYYVLASDAFDGTGGFAAPLDDVTHCETGAAQPDQPATKTRIYILRHPQEDESKFNWRIRNATYTNVVRSVLETLLGFLFSRAPVRQWPKGSDWAEWAEDVDGLGTSLDDFERDVALRLMLHGTAISTVNRTEGDFATLAEARLAGAATYVVNELPEALYDWRTDTVGNLTAVKFVDEQTEGDLLDKEVGTWARCRIMRRGDSPTTAGSYERWRQDETGKDAEQDGDTVTLPPAVGIPVVLQVLDKLVGGGLLGTTIFRQLCDEQLGLYREMSLLFEHIHAQNFAVLTRPKESGAQQTNIVIGTDNALEYDKTGAAPAYIAPPASVAETLFTTIDKRIARIYELVGLDALRGGQQAESGIARQWRFNPLNRRLTSVARGVSAWERKTLRLRAAWEGKDPAAALDGYSCERPEDFDVKDVERSLKINLDAQLLPLGKTARDKMLIAIRDDLVTLDEDEKAKSDAEISEASDAAEERRNAPPVVAPPVNEPETEEAAPPAEAV